jgi:hypothetical protein
LDKKESRKYKLIPILISLIILLIACINLYLTLPTPNLEVGMFPEKSVLYSNTVVVNWTTNESNQTVFSSYVDNSTRHGEYNFTFQIFNSGKGVARNVNVSIRGEPSDAYQVNATYIFVGEPLKSNLLDIVHDHYNIGLLGEGKSYTFLFSLRTYTEIAEEGKFVLKVQSDNAGTQLHYIVFEK